MGNIYTRPKKMDDCQQYWEYRNRSATKRYPDKETHKPKVELRAKQNSDRGWGGESSNNIFVKYVYLTSRYALVIHERIPIFALNHLVFIPHC